MPKAKKPEGDPDMLPEYDFSKGVRGKYVAMFTAGTNAVVLAPDVAEAFPTSEAVNEALRQVLRNRQKRESTP